MLRIPSKHKFTSIKQFQLIQHRKVGCGSFGMVKLARHRKTCRMYALKIIELKQMPSEAEVRLVERQIKLHSQLSHPHVIQLWDTIQDADSIYMVMEYAEQGNLFAYQNTKAVFNQSQSFKFFTQTLHGLHYLHGQNVIHRDLKPQNLLLDAMGNIKICDFGWCAEEIKVKRTTFCGTYQYMAPQMLFNSQYDYRVDIWALGILLYQMLHGRAPFKGKSTQQVKEAMIGGSYQLGNHLSGTVKDLIRSVLQFNPQRRLSLEQILRHPWILDMENYMNDYLTLENVVLPKQIQHKISLAPPPPMTPTISKHSNKRRKNNSLNFEEAGHNININLQINNYSIVGKGKKNTYHSQEKDKEVNQFTSFDHRPVQTKKGKMDPVNRSQIEPKKGYEANAVKILDRIKSAKPSKFITKQMASLEKKCTDNHGNKKKMKLRRSEVQTGQRHEKQPVRFNTEANEQWCQAPRLKKGGTMKSKMLTASKSALRLHKNSRD